MTQLARPLTLMEVESLDTLHFSLTLQDSMNDKISDKISKFEFANRNDLQQTFTEF